MIARYGHNQSVHDILSSSTKMSEKTSIEVSNLSKGQIFRHAAHKLYIEYLEKSIAHGLRMIRRTQNDSYGRYIWLGVMAFVLILTHLTVYDLALEFVQTPTETRLSAKVVHIKNVVFPAIAICSNNQISKRALDVYAEDLYKFQERYHPKLAANSTAELAHRLLAIVGFLLYPFDSFTTVNTELRNLHDLLVFKYSNDSYPTRTIIRRLAPRCEDLIVRCSIARRPIKCSETFFSRTTTSGVCCLFNYRRKSYNTDKELYERDMKASAQSGKIHFKAAGPRNSLQVVIQDDTSDYTVKEYPCDGFRAFLFYPDDYPDIETGSVTRALIGYNEEHEISIQPDILEGSARMRQFSSKMRHCYFLEEGQDLLKQEYYSFSECMLHCRAHSIINHCGCMVPVLPGYVNNVSYCTLLDLPCISLWKAIWWQWNSFDYVTEDKSPSILEICDYCLPSCNVLSYKINVNSRPINVPEKGDHFRVGILQGLPTSRPTSALRFSYKSTFSQVKHHDISGDWIALLGRYGGICSIMYGFSIVGIIELVYFVTGKWFAVWWRCLVQCYRSHKKQKELVEKHQELYWNELMPKGTFAQNERN